MSKITSGEVEIELAGETKTLTCTLNAATRISRHFGGFQAAHQQLLGQNFDAYVVIIRHGLGLRTDAEIKALTEQVYRTGLSNLVVPLVDFVLMLANGGRPIEGLADEEPDEGNGA